MYGHWYFQQRKTPQSLKNMHVLHWKSSGVIWQITIQSERVSTAQIMCCTSQLWFLRPLTSIRNRPYTPISVLRWTSLRRSKNSRIQIRYIWYISVPSQWPADGRSRSTGEESETRSILPSSITMRCRKYFPNWQSLIRAWSTGFPSGRADSIP